MSETKTINKAGATFQAVLSNPLTWKVIIYIILIIVLIITIKNIFDWVKSLIGSGSSDAWKKDIEDKLNRMEIDKSQLIRPEAFYSALAETQYDLMNAWLTNTSQVISTIDLNLNADELRQVAKDFGARSSTVSLLPGTWQEISQPRTIFQWYEWELKGKNLEKMKEIWRSSDLWY